MAQSREDSGIAPASIWRLTLSGTVLFLLQYAITMVVGFIIMLPFMFFFMLPMMQAVETESDPAAAMSSIFAVFPLIFVGGLLFQILATALALGFVVGKRWAGARLVFLYE